MPAAASRTRRHPSRRAPAVAHLGGVRRVPRVLSSFCLVNAFHAAALFPGSPTGTFSRTTAACWRKAQRGFRGDGNRFRFVGVFELLRFAFWPVPRLDNRTLRAFPLRHGFPEIWHFRSVCFVGGW